MVESFQSQNTGGGRSRRTKSVVPQGINPSQFDSQNDPFA